MNQNEKNYQLLSNRFNNENKFGSKLQIEIDYRNDPLEMKIVDENGNETIHQIEKITGNEKGITLHCRNGNETCSGNGNGKWI